MFDHSIQAPRDGGPRSHPGRRASQYGAVQVLLSWQGLAGAVRTPLVQLADRLGLRVERSFNDQYDCELAYLETDQDAYTLVSWQPSHDVEVWAALSVDDRHGSVDFPVGTEEFRLPRPRRGARRGCRDPARPPPAGLDSIRDP